MKLSNRTHVIVVAKAEPAKSQDGKSTYYRIACLQNGQATNLSVSEDVYADLPTGYVDVIFNTTYDDKYQSFRVESIAEIVSINGEKPGAKADVKPDVKPSGTPAAK